jgi:hypothetical protein
MTACSYGQAAVAGCVEQEMRDVNSAGTVAVVAGDAGLGDFLQGTVG